MKKKEPPRKVGYLLKRYPRLSQTFILNEMLELENQGVDVTVFALKGSDDPIIHDQCRKLKAPVHYLSAASPIDGDAAAFPALMARWVKKLGIAHIHAHFATWAAAAASCVSERTGVPFSFTAHARDIYHESVDKKGLAGRIEKAAFVITVSDFNKKYLEELLRSENRSGRIIRLYNGIDLDLFKPFRGEKEPGLLVGIGRLVPKKGFSDLIEACKLLKERGRVFHCAVIGDGEEKTALEERIKKYALEKEVSLSGARSQSEVIRMVQRAAVFVLPCMVGEDGDRDGLPTVLLESMALGTPVVSTSVSGIPEIIRDRKSGLLVPEKNPKALAEAIEGLLDSSSLRAGLSRAALIKVRRNFNLAVNVSKLKSCFLSGGETSR